MGIASFLTPYKGTGNRFSISFLVCPTEQTQHNIYGRVFYVFVLSCVCYVFVRVCLYVLCGHLLWKGWPLGSRLWCLLWVCHFPIGILGQVWFLIVSIPDLWTLTYFYWMTLNLFWRVYYILTLLHMRNKKRMFVSYRNVKNSFAKCKI